MAARPLPPGRRGRGASRAVSGLHHLPEPKLLDVPASATPTSSSSYSAASPSAPVASASSASVPPPSAPAAAPGAPPSPLLEADAAPAKRVAQVIAALEADAVPAGIRFGAETATPSTTTPRQHAPPPVSAPTLTPAAPASPAAPPAASAGYATVASFTATPEPAVVASEPTPVRVRAVAPVPTPAPAPAPVPAPVASPVPSPPASEGVPAELGELHPFRLLLPVERVPEVPESVECVYDDAAVAMQKSVLRVLKKVLGKKDKLKLEDFKINSRLFGNNFMEAAEYFDSLVADLGAVRALQLAPCLGTLQADYMKRTGLLLAARSYRLRHLAALEAQCAAMRAAAAPPAPAPVAAAVAAAAPVQPNEPPAVAAAPSEAALSKATESTASLAAAAPVASLKAVAAAAEAEASSAETVSSDAVGFTDAVSEERLFQSVEATEVIAAPSADAVAVAVLLGAAAAEAGATFVEEPTLAVADPVEAPEVAAETEKHVEHAAATATWHEASEVVSDSLSVSHESRESDEENQSPPAAAPAPASSAIDSAASVSAVVSTAEAREAAASPPESFVADLPLAFQHLFSSDEVVVAASKRATPAAAASSQARERSDSTDAENLFGERFSVESSSSETAENLFGESIYEPKLSAAVSSTSNGSSHDGAASSAPVVAPTPAHSQLLFGFATAGADTDSDSDDSGFSSP